MAMAFRDKSFKIKHQQTKTHLENVGFADEGDRLLDILLFLYHVPDFGLRV